MKKSLKVFLKSIIDYAGLFPPAELSLDAAIRNFADYRSQADRWMLSRFIIPASRLDDLAPYAEELFSSNDPFDFSVLGKGTETTDEFYHQLDEVISSCRAFHDRYEDKVTTDLLEIKLPKEAAFSNDVGLLKELMNRTGQKLQAVEEAPSYIFYEGFFEESWKKDIKVIIEGIAAHNEYESGGKYYDFAGFKLRCGGMQADMFPRAEQVVFALNRARDAGVILKCTAGLHHPVRHYAEEVQTKMHGFLNVFGGAILSHANDLSDEQLEEIICEEDAEQFQFTDEEFRWGDYSVSTQGIEKLRKEALLSYGSCSFDEPREDLQKLGFFKSNFEL